MCRIATVGRRGAGEPPRVRADFTIGQDVLAVLGSESKRTRINKSRIVEAALRDYLNLPKSAGITPENLAVTKGAE